jgi:hypothetical protein
MVDDGGGTASMSQGAGVEIMSPAFVAREAEHTGWSADQIRQLRHICGPTMEAAIRWTPR